MSSSFLSSQSSTPTNNRITNVSDVKISQLNEKFLAVKASTTVLPTKVPQTTRLPSNQAFAHKSNKLFGLLTDTKSILERYREVNKGQWFIQYPFLSNQRPQNLSGNRQFMSQDDCQFRSADRLNQNFSTEPFNKFRQQIFAKLYASTSDTSSHEISAKLNVLKLDLKQGDSSSAEIMMEKLDICSIAKLLDRRFAQGIKRIENLASRVADKSSKVLVAGDVNAGKSTFVNALLRREVMPVDQQPCTTIFCEVLDVLGNTDAEEVHAIKNIESYNQEDPTTYTKIELSNLLDMVSSGTEEYAQLKVYCKDKRTVQQSLLHNGVVDIALIDCPGLNIDTLKTTALFARQEEIDVIIFVVSAENHFTLSAKEFLSNASNEKAYLFIVVNRFDNIRDKEKCKRLVLDQIREVSPRTYDHADDLVHFVTSTAVPIEGGEENNASVSSSLINNQRIADFNRLEESLRTFVLKKRSKSKLAPAHHYLDNIVNDIGILAEFNGDIASYESKKAKRDLEDGQRAFDKLCNDERLITEKADKCADDACDSIMLFTKRRLEGAISNMTSVSIECPGLLHVWNYANDVRDAMLDEISKEIVASEENAKNEARLCISKIQSMASNLNGEPRQINLEKMYSKSGERFTISISPSDFFDFNVSQNINDCLSIVGFSGCTMVAVASKMNALSSLWKVSNVVGLHNMRRVVLPLIVLAGAGVCAFFLYDMDRVIPRKIAKKIQQELGHSQYVDKEANRIARQGRKKIRLATEDLRLRFRRAVEEQELSRISTQQAYRQSQEAVKFFEDIICKAEKMSETLSALGHEWEDTDEWDTL